MVTKILFLLFFPLLNVLSSSLDECPEFNLKNKGESMEHVPVKEQAYGTCYGYSASMAIDAYIYSSGFSDYTYKSDPIYLSALYTMYHENYRGLLEKSFLPYDDETNDLTIVGGLGYQTFNQAIKESVCMDNQEKSSIFVRLSNDTKERIKLFFKFYNQMHFRTELENTAYMKQDNTYVSKTLIIPEKSEKQEEEELIQLAKELVDNIIPQLSDSDYKKIGIFLQSSYHSDIPSLDFLIALSSSGCKKVDISNAQVDGFLRYSEKEIYRKNISQYLTQTQKKQPLLISYCHTALQTDQNGINKSLKEIDSECCGAHASLIIGARKKDNKCQYLIRDNSTCDRSKIGECDEDTIDSWVDANKVLDQTYRIFYLK